LNADLNSIKTQMEESLAITTHELTEQLKKLNSKIDLMNKKHLKLIQKKNKSDELEVALQYNFNKSKERFFFF
jgi:hypothetical protein